MQLVLCKKVILVRSKEKMADWPVFFNHNHLENMVLSNKLNLLKMYLYKKLFKKKGLAIKL